MSLLKKSSIILSAIIAFYLSDCKKRPSLEYSGVLEQSVSVENFHQKEFLEPVFIGDSMYLLEQPEINEIRFKGTNIDFRIRNKRLYESLVGKKEAIVFYREIYRDGHLAGYEFIDAQPIIK